MDQDGQDILDFLGYMRHWSIERVLKEIRATEKLTKTSGMTVVWDLLEKAVVTNDGTYLLRSYTTSSNFGKELNKMLAHMEDPPVVPEVTYHSPDEILTVVFLKLCKQLRIGQCTLSVQFMAIVAVHIEACLAPNVISVNIKLID